jgi:hypothetical protein
MLKFTEMTGFYDFIVISVFILLICISLQESILEQLEKDLGNHMVIEHILFFVFGALSVTVAETILKIMIRKDRQHVAAVRTSNITAVSKARAITIQYWKVLLRKIFKLNEHVWIWIVVSVLLMSVWHIPEIFDYAFTHSQIHVLQHLSFVIVGAFIFITIRILGESFNLFLLFSLIGMMGFSGLIFVILDSQIYQVYSISSHHNAGNYMIISFSALLLVITPAYLIKRTIFHLKAKTLSK